MHTGVMSNSLILVITCLNEWQTRTEKEYSSYTTGALSVLWAVVTVVLYAAVALLICWGQFSHYSESPSKFGRLKQFEQYIILMWFSNWQWKKKNVRQRDIPMKAQEDMPRGLAEREPWCKVVCICQGKDGDLKEKLKLGSYAVLLPSGKEMDT